jgi:hypothetical protein
VKEVAKAESKLGALQGRAGELQQELGAAWGAAAEGGVPMATMAGGLVECLVGCWGGFETSI